MQKILLKDAYPDLAEQVVDKGLLETLGSSSKEKIRWHCDEGHEWDAIVLNRTKKGRGCPYCSGRFAIPGETDLATLRPDIAVQLVDPSLASTLKVTSHAKVEWKCEQGHMWFAPVSARTSKNSSCPYCSGRSAWAGESDIATTHPELAEQLVDMSLATTLKAGSNKKAEWECPDCHQRWFATPNSRVQQKAGCPYCAGKRRVRGSNDLATTHPDLVKQMDAKDKHFAIELSANSQQSVTWHCSRGHTWQAPIVNRARTGQGCPYCSGQRILAGFNDLATLRPDIAAELVDTSLGTQLAEYTHRVVEWVCERGHVWTASVASRTYGGRTCPQCSEAGKSKAETELYDIVCTLLGADVEVRRNDKTLLDGLELDIVVPSEQVAIEFNGVWWHSEGVDVKRARTRHYEKYKQCLDIGYQLLQVWEDDWRDKRDVVIRMIAAKLGVTSNLLTVLDDAKYSYRYGARNLICADVDISAAHSFLIENHIQGFVSATKYFGLLTKEGDAVALLACRAAGTSGRTIRASGVWEIVRYATCCSVAGGFSRLLVYATKTIVDEGLLLTKWVTFSDNMVSNGMLYQKMGFEDVKHLAPDYRYVGGVTKQKRVAKEFFQKKRFRDDPRLQFDENMTERELAQLNGLNRVWDAGKIRWELQVNTA